MGVGKHVLIKEKHVLNWVTYHDKRHKINPIPERVSILHHIHDVNPSFKTDHLQVTLVSDYYA